MDALRIEMIRRGLKDSHDLARLTGRSARTIQNLLCHNNRSWVLRRQIEDAMETVFWSTVEEFQERQRERNKSCR